MARSPPWGKFLTFSTRKISFYMHNLRGHPILIFIFLPFYTTFYKCYPNKKKVKNFFFFFRNSEFFFYGQKFGIPNKFGKLASLVNTSRNVCVGGGGGVCVSKHLLHLSDAYLMRVPITVKDDDSISSLQVETKTSSTSTQQEEKVLRVWSIEQTQQTATIFRLGCSIQTKIFVT